MSKSSWNRGLLFRVLKNGWFLHPYSKNLLNALRKWLNGKLQDSGSSWRRLLPCYRVSCRKLRNGISVAMYWAKVGWLPHYTMPFAAIAKSDRTEDQISATILEYYARKWENVREHIDNRLAGYKIDAEAKATFREALDAHGSGLHRCVCRVLFPEIERVLITKLFGGILGGERITYDKCIRTLVGEDRHIEDFIVDGLYDLSVFGQITKAVREKDRQNHGEKRLSETDEMISGIFSSVRNEGRRESLTRSPIPNRHAAMHGLVSYSSPQHSLNTIFLADYMFSIVSRISTSGLPQ